MKQLSFKENFLNIFFYTCNNILGHITNCIYALRYKCNDFDEKMENEKGKCKKYKTYSQMVYTQYLLQLMKTREIINNHYNRIKINTSWQRNNKKPFEIGRITLRLDSTNINRAYYEDPRKESLLVAFNIHEEKCLPQLVGQTVKDLPRRKLAPMLINFVVPAPRSALRIIIAFLPQAQRKHYCCQRGGLRMA